MKLTALGRKFYKDKHTEYVVEVPVIIQVTDANGKQRTRTNEHLPVNMLGLGQILVSQALSDAAWSCDTLGGLQGLGAPCSWRSRASASATTATAHGSSAQWARRWTLRGGPRRGR